MSEEEGQCRIPCGKCHRCKSIHETLGAAATRAYDLGARQFGEGSRVLDKLDEIISWMVGCEDDGVERPLSLVEEVRDELTNGYKG